MTRVYVANIPTSSVRAGTPTGDFHSGDTAEGFTYVRRCKKYLLVYFDLFTKNTF